MAIGITKQGEYICQHLVTRNIERLETITMHQIRYSLRKTVPVLN